MLDRFAQYIAQQHLFAKGDKVLLAVSGGRDSVAMEHLFHAHGMRYGVAHCNFNLRPTECLRDEQFVSQLARQHGAPLHVAQFDTHAYAQQHGMGTEEAARHLRYNFFASLCRQHGYCAVAVAHHADDSVETFLLNLLRGTGLSGLHGIKPLSWWTPTDAPSAIAAPMRVVRPMLGFSRAEIDAFVAEKHLPYVDDSTNFCADVRRNQLRLQVLPLLRQVAPMFDKVMLQNIGRLSGAEQLLADYVALLRRQLTILPSAVPGVQCNYISVPMPMVQQSSAPQTLLFELLRPYGFAPHVVADMIDATISGALFLSPTHQATLCAGSLVVGPLGVVPHVVLAQRFAPPQTAIATVRGNSRAIAVDAAAVQQPLTLRPWQAADRFVPFGMRGSRLVSDFLKDQKLHRLDKQHVQLLVDVAGRVVWVVGFRADNRFAITKNTHSALIVEVQ